MVDYLTEHLPTATVVWGDDDPRPMVTFWRSLVENDIGHLHLEDDCTLGTRFGEVEQHVGDGTQMVQFFSRSKSDLVEGSRWQTGSRWMYNVCCFIPAGWGAEIAEYGSSWPRQWEHPGGFDYLIADFLQATRRKYFLVVPSLVQHTPLPTTLSPRARVRTSPTFTDPILINHPYPELMEPR
jgi:hypothetical protein